MQVGGHGTKNRSHRKESYLIDHLSSLEFQRRDDLDDLTEIDHPLRIFNFYCNCNRNYSSCPPIKLKSMVIN